MNQQEQIKLVCAHALTHLAQEQLPGGGFPSYSSPQASPFLKDIAHLTTFIPSLILCALNTTPLLETTAIRKNIVTFLLNEKGPDWSFNYWSKTDNHRATHPYPNDLDDTFCALAGLVGFDSSLISGKALVTILSLLTSTEVAPGGPYRTWLVNATVNSVWCDTDLGVNSAVAHFLLHYGASVPGITTLQEDSIQTTTFTSPYYHEWHMLTYYLARSYRGIHTTTLQNYILNQWNPKTGWGNPLQNAVCITSLLKLKYPPDLLEEALTLLLRQTSPSWHPYACAIDPNRENIPHFSGSSSLTAALVVEALSLFTALAPAQTTKYSRTQRHSSTITSHGQALPLPLKDLYLSSVTRITNSPNGELLLSFQDFLVSCFKNQQFSEQFLTQLNLLIIFGWTSYTLYDDIFDEYDSLACISVANYCLRELTLVLTNLFPDNHTFLKQSLEIMCRMDSANSWELLNCRIQPLQHSIDLRNIALPDFSNLIPIAEKSLGHTLPALALLQARGYGLDSPESQALLHFFQHYLICRQLNDDAHDWKDDLEKGHLTPVTTLLLRTWDTHYPESVATATELERMYWQEVLPTVCTLIKGHATKAQSRLKILQPTIDTKRLITLLQPYLAAANTALTTHATTRDFLYHYNKISD